ncbi:RICIN domain-containing protein [Streptacidiphilus sp. N1-12]|uniref:RICIN domain-containing protein n=2 Tax=Streptacidiphilus alkalitolerans TaxID=3342712 RepID=A0ABV6VKK0_9ACTN
MRLKHPKKRFLATTAVTLGALAALVAVPASARADDSLGTFKIQNSGWTGGSKTPMCLWGAGGNGARTYVQKCSNDNHDRWTFYPIGSAGQPGSWYELVNVATGECLDADANNLTGGAQVQSWGCNQAYQQRWRFTPRTNYYQRVANLGGDAANSWANDRFYLDMDAQYQRLWSSDSSNNQLWSMFPG